MPRDNVTRDQIVKAAITVYWHVGNKDSLITLVGNEAWNEIATRPGLDS